jgi:hypothetical protein
MAMTLLMTPAEVVTLSFIQPEVTPMRPAVILDAVIKAAEEQFIKPLITASLYNAIYAAPVTYASLIDQIKPCLAYYTKLLTFNEFMLSEDANFVNLSADARQELLKSIHNIAKANAKTLLEYVKANYPLQYTAPLKKRVAGLLLIPKS